ncbi:Ion-translocating oxidoreductase complex subunit C [subsurface metagenome]
MQREGDKIIDGLKLLIVNHQAEKGIIAVSKSDRPVVADLKRLAEDCDSIDLFFIEDFYPAADQAILIYEITGQPVSRVAPAAISGSLVYDLQTVIDIYEAVTAEEPVTRRLLTCTGEVAFPSLVLGHLGVSFREVIELCGGATTGEYVILSGAPARGAIITDIDTPVTKSTTTITVLPADHELVKERSQTIGAQIRKSKSVCNQCSFCTELCPVYLLGGKLYPHLIMRQIAHGLAEPEELILGALLCSECGICEVFACPHKLSPRAVNVEIKERLKQEARPESLLSSQISGQIQPCSNRNYRKLPFDRLANLFSVGPYAESPKMELLETSPGQVELLFQEMSAAGVLPGVKTGEEIAEGSMVAETKMSKGAALHTSIGGKITFLDKERVIIRR